MTCSFHTLSNILLRIIFELLHSKGFLSHRMLFVKPGVWVNYRPLHLMAFQQCHFASETQPNIKKILTVIIYKCQWEKNIFKRVSKWSILDNIIISCKGNNRLLFTDENHAIILHRYGKRFFPRSALVNIHFPQSALVNIHVHVLSVIIPTVCTCDTILYHHIVLRQSNFYL